MATDLLFRRLVRVTIATKLAEDYKTVTTEVVEVEDLRVMFKVVKTGKKEPNTAEVTIANLSPTRRASLQQKGVKFILQAGYEGTGIGQIFVGDARTVDHKRDGANWLTVVKSGDGERAYNFARVSESFAAGSPVSDVVQNIANAFGIGLGNLKSQLGAMTGSYDNGYAAHGPASRELDKVLRGAGFEWSIQDNEIFATRPGQPGAVLVPELSPETGLIGSPEYGSAEKKGKKPLLKIRCLLNPAIKIGGQVVVRSERHNGPVTVKKLEHTGDTAGGDWYTDIEGQPQ